MTGSGYEGPEGRSEGISGPSRDQSGGVDSEVNLVDSEVNLGPILDPSLRNLIKLVNSPSFGRR